MKRWGFLLLVFLAACNGPFGSTAPGETSSAPTAVASAAACKLPFFGSGQRVVGGVISFPTGEFKEDPSSELVRDQARGSWRTVAEPPLYGDSSNGSYDRTKGRWVPVPAAQISPDGSRYAYTEATVAFPAPPSRIHVVDMATGNDRIVYSQGNYRVAVYAAEGIYLVHHLPQTDSSDGLWLLDPGQGTLKQMAADRREWDATATGAAWSIDLDSTDPHPPQGGMSPANRVLRMDLPQGTITPWFYRPGKQVSVLGFDGKGSPLVAVTASGTVEISLVTGRDSGRPISSGPTIGSPNSLVFLGPPVGDEHGVWFLTRAATGNTSQTDLWLYRGSALEKVASSSLFTGGSMRLAGKCG